MLCESAGRWPSAVQMVIIVLLAKADGGFRPIGLIPAIPRIWMRVRRQAAKQWEQLQARPYLYAGASKGATVAAWKQSARAEYAAASSMGYGQALLDLVKAFERIPHSLLVHEARALGYPLWMIRLAISTYKLQRVVRVGSAVSSIIEAIRGITAGSGLATTEMRLAMIRIVDGASLAHPAAALTLFVDDLGIDELFSRTP